MQSISKIACGDCGKESYDPNEFEFCVDCGKPMCDNHTNYEFIDGLDEPICEECMRG